MSTSPKLEQMAKDLSTEFPRSPRETLAGYVIAARTLDKCRAQIAGTLGPYHFDCPLDNQFFDFTAISADAFRDFVATGASDEAVADWIVEHSDVSSREELIQWNNELRGRRISEMPMELQVFLEDYIPSACGSRPVYCWFDVYDIEEKRI